LKSLKERLPKLVAFFTKWDWVWSIPLFTVLYWLTGYLLAVSGFAISVFDISFIQPLVLAVLIVVGASAAAQFIILFHLDEIWNHYFGIRVKDRLKLIMESLTPMQQLKTLLYIWAFIMFLVVFVYTSVLR